MERRWTSPARWYPQYLRLVDGNPGRAAGALLLACLPLTLGTAVFFSRVRGGLQDLLPADAPAVRAIETVHARFSGRASLVVVAASPDVDANRRFIDALGARIEEQHIPEVRSVQAGCDREQRWLERHAALLMPQRDFDRLLDRVDATVEATRRGANPLFVELDDDARAVTMGDAPWQRLASLLDDAVAPARRFPAGRFEGDGGRVVLALVWLDGSETERGPSDRLLRAVRREVDALRPRFPADLRIHFSGEVMSLVEEYDAVAADLLLSSAIVFLLVGLIIAVYFRSLRALAVVLCGLLPGLLLTFTAGFLVVGHVNSNTGFLGSIIAGNGINYPLLFLAYYRGVDPHLPRREALRLASRRAWPGTLGAAVTAAAAYGALATSTFRGFSQFGWLGGVGMVSVWAGTFLATPIAIAWIDPPRRGAAPTLAQAALARFFAHRRRAAVVAASFVVAATGFAAAGVRFAQRHGMFDMDLRNLASRASLSSGSRSWGATLGEVFGVWPSATTAIVDDPAHLPALVAALDEALLHGPRPLGARMESLAALLPPRDQQEERLVRLRRVAHALAEVPREDVPAHLRSRLDDYLADEALRVITAGELPTGPVANLAERDGRRDRTVVIFPRHDVDFDDARNVIAFATRLKEARLPPDATIGGSFVLMAEVFRVVSLESARVVVIAWLLVALLLVPIFARRPLRIPWVMAVVALVALVSQAQMLALGVRINMINFAAIPITIGVGADYLINLLAATDGLKVDAPAACARMGGAILVCSLTTMVGYASLLFAESGALRNFGWAAALGELMAVVTVLLVMPAFWPRRRSSDSAAAPGDPRPNGELDEQKEDGK